MTIAVDFDGTIVEHRYPEIGEERPFAIDTLKMLIKDRHKLILWRFYYFAIRFLNELDNFLFCLIFCCT